MVDETRPAQTFIAVSKSDTVDATRLDNGEYPRALYVGVSGDVAVVAMDGRVVTFKAVPVGVLPVRFKRINSGSTTATDMVALY